ncbi:MAG: hypothetical protein NVSMB27_46380 [Ktedonobacteraceae bacterium]
MILLLLLILSCSIGCLIALVSATRSLVISIRQATNDIAFLTPVLVSSRDGKRALLPFGLQQVQCLAASLQTDDEVQA